MYFPFSPPLLNYNIQNKLKQEQKCFQLYRIDLERTELYCTHVDHNQFDLLHHLKSYAPNTPILCWF